MIGLLQRVGHAKVSVDGEIIAEIGRGLAVLVGVERGDGDTQAKRLAERLVEYRVFPDESGRMNLSLRDVGGAMLLVPQFTLAADTGKGARPGFSRAAEPDLGAALFDTLVGYVGAQGVATARGRFGASMQVTLTNEGPVTFWLQTAPGRRDGAPAL